MERDVRELLGRLGSAVGAGEGRDTAAPEANCCCDEEVGPKLGDLHWREATGMGQKSRVPPAEAAGMLEAARHAKRLRDPGWMGDRGQGR